MSERIPDIKVSKDGWLLSTCSFSADVRQRKPPSVSKSFTSSVSAWLAGSSEAIVAPGDLLLNDCDVRAALCNSDLSARGDLGGVFPDMLRMSLGTVVCCGAGLACSALEQADHEASSTSWPTWTDAPCCCSRVPNFVSKRSGFTFNICRWQRGKDCMDVEVALV